MNDDMNEVTKKVKPNTLPFKCPNCNGYGTVQYGKKICHSCGGTGIVFVPQMPEKEVSYE
jgi:DnaJ-class molecular chaperone